VKGKTNLVSCDIVVFCAMLHEPRPSFLNVPPHVVVACEIRQSAGSNF
jgi:hypothetical protein